MLQLRSGRMAIRVSLLWRRTCSRAGLLRSTIRGTAHEVSLLLGLAARVCSQVYSQGCPGLSFRAGSLHPRGCVLEQGLCCLPGSALSLPGELPTAPGDKLWVEGVMPGRAEAFWSQEGVAWVRGAHRFRSPARAFAEGPFEAGHQGNMYLKVQEPVLSVFRSSLAGGQWEMGIYFSALVKARRPQF